MTHADVVVIGGGAAGLMCAITAGQRGRRVVLVEGSNRVGKKILMSGGGRCNFTNLRSNPAAFLSANPHFCKSALSRYRPSDFIALVDSHGISWHKKTLGQLFCDNSSKDIVAMLQAEAESANVTTLTDCKDIAIEADNRFSISSSRGTFQANSLVIATGGLSIPKMGASDFGYRVARQFGHKLVDTSAGLVPFTFTGELHDMFSRLSGVGCAAAVTAGGTTFEEAILFTHRGLSGPAALQASNYWNPGEDIVIDLLPGEDMQAILGNAKQNRPKTLLRSIVDNYLPRALVVELQSLLWPEIADRVLGEVPDAVLEDTATVLRSWEVRPAATEGYRTAEVTLGGVDTRQLSSKTMESSLQEGLYFVGEVVDVTGHLGGFNFQWAWASGRAAGLVV